MYKKYLRYLSLCVLCFICLFAYITSSHDSKVKTTKEKTNMQTVIYKDQDDTLIPVSLDLKNGNTTEDNIRSVIEMMKSNDFISKGLYPLLNDKVELNTLIIGNHQYTFDFNKSLTVKNNQEALDFCEAMSYLFCHDGIKKINIKIDGHPVSSLEQSSIPLSCITNQLGINNFETTSRHLYETSSVTIYNQRQIKGMNYYVPVSTRIDNAYNSLDDQVSLILNHFDYSKALTTSQESKLNDGLLSIYFSSDVLDQSETLDETLYQRLEKSFLSLPDVTNIHIYIDHELVEKQKHVSSIIDNTIQI